MEKKRTGYSLAAALLAAVVGGIVWAAIVVISNYELGLIAWGIGLLAGLAVTKAAKEQISQTDQIIAVAASLLGIVLGKYFYISYLINDGINGMFDRYSFMAFQDVIMQTVGLMDLLFVALAVVTAWRIPGQAIKSLREGTADTPAEPPATGPSF